MNLEILMPILLLALSFVIKLLTDRSVNVFDFLRSLLELPTEIAFLAISLIVAFTISNDSNHGEGLAWFVAFMVGVIMIVFLWRRSEALLINTSGTTTGFGTNKACFLAGGLAILNYLIATSGLIYAIGLLIPEAAK